MILKQSPEDFQVEELTDVQPGEGPFSLYRLEKSGWTTPDALQAIRRRWQLDRHRLSYGGLKDRHAQTVQYFTIFRGPQRRLTHQGFTVTYLGQVTQPFLAEHIRANRFQLILRDVSKEERATFSRTFEEVRVSGVPNYFDDQRFGSVTARSQESGIRSQESGIRNQESGIRNQESGVRGQESAISLSPDSCLLTPDSCPSFLAKSIILGRYEEALKLALTAYYPHDRGPQKREKAVLRSHWGNWAQCKDLLPRGHARSLVDYLVSHPEDFRGALSRLRPELRGLYLSAYQSHLWNRILAAWLRAHLRPDQLTLVPLKLGAVPMHRGLDEAELSRVLGLQIPLPSHRAHFEEGDPRQPLFDEVLREENLTLDQFKLKGFREMFFSRGDRPALCLAGNLKYTPNPDDTHPGKQKLRLTFDLPRGGYATLLVKRLTTPMAGTGQADRR